MRELRGIVASALLLIPPVLSAESAPPRVVDPEADRIMERACEQLKSAPAFSVEADISYDDVLTSGLTVQYQRMNQLVLDRPHHLRILRGHHGIGITGTRRAAGPTNPVKIGLGCVGDIEIDHMRDLTDVDAARRDIGRNQNLHTAIAKAF